MTISIVLCLFGITLGSQIGRTGFVGILMWILAIFIGSLLVWEDLHDWRQLSDVEFLDIAAKRILAIALGVMVGEIFFGKRSKARFGKDSWIRIRRRGH